MNDVNFFNFTLVTKKKIDVKYLTEFVLRGRLRDKLLKLMCVQVIVITLSVSCLCCYNAFWCPCITYVLGI